MKRPQKDQRQANRGLDFEELINHANEQYKTKGTALIFKIPTDWQVLRGYDKRAKKNTIKNAFPKAKSTVDYIGIYRGRAVAFEAKSTKNKTSFTLASIQDHQRQFLDRWMRQGGLAFYLINFKAHGAVYILEQRQLEEFVESNDRKSIPITYFEKFCRKAKADKGIVLNYLEDL